MKSYSNFVLWDLKTVRMMMSLTVFGGCFFNATFCTKLIRLSNWDDVWILVLIDFQKKQPDDDSTPSTSNSQTDLFSGETNSDNSNTSLTTQAANSNQQLLTELNVTSPSKEECKCTSPQWEQGRHKCLALFSILGFTDFFLKVKKDPLRPFAPLGAKGEVRSDSQNTKLLVLIEEQIKRGHRSF